jgi:hypothetical protein
MSNVEVAKTPLEKALEQHLTDHDLVPVAKLAIAYATLAAKGEVWLLNTDLELPHGETAKVEQVVKDLHLNAFIDTGGGDV